MTKKLVALCGLSLPLAAAAAGPPACVHWFTYMSLGYLQTAGLLDPATLDFDKTKVVLLASQQLRKDRYRQVVELTYEDKSGHRLAAISMGVVSWEECSMGAVTTYLVSQRFSSP